MFGILVTLVYALGSGYFVDNSGWYSSLRRPAWQPPDWVFGVIWPYNFLALGFASWQLASGSRPGLHWVWVSLFAASVAAALMWSYEFYRSRRLGRAARYLQVAAVLTVPVFALPWFESPLAGALLIPYQVWIVLAAGLSTAYARLNGQGQ